MEPAIEKYIQFIQLAKKQQHTLSIYIWTNQKHLKSPKCKLCVKTKNINHLYIDSKRNKTIWNYSQKYYQSLTKKIIHSIATYINILTLSLPLKTKKLVLTLTMTILSHIWKTRKITISHHNYTHNYTIINIKQWPNRHYTNTIKTTNTR